MNLFHEKNYEEFADGWVRFGIVYPLTVYHSQIVNLFHKKNYEEFADAWVRFGVVYYYRDL